MSGEKNSASKPRLEFQSPTEALHSYEQIKIHAVPGGDTTDNNLKPSPSTDNPRQSQHKYDAVDFMDEPSEGQGSSKEPGTLYEVPRPVSPPQDQHVIPSGGSSEYNVPKPVTQEQYMALGNQNASSEYKVPVQRKKRKLFKKKSESRSTIIKEGEEPEYEEGQVNSKWKERLSTLSVTNRVHFVLLVVAIVIAALALVISFASLGVSSSRSCDCPSPVAQFDTMYNCTTSTLSVCSITQTTVNDPPNCLTTPVISSSLNSFSQFHCSVDPGSEQRPITASLVYEDIAGASPSVQCLCFVVVSNQTQLVSSGVQCALKSTECRVDFKN